MGRMLAARRHFEPARCMPGKKRRSWTVRLNGTVYCHKAMRKSYSELGLRRAKGALGDRLWQVEGISAEEVDVLEGEARLGS